MLHGVPNQINKAKRLVTLKHPNAYKALAFRKVVNRDAGGATVGGIPVLGGASVISSEDEHNVDWSGLGHAKVLFADQFGVSSMVDDGTTFDYAEAGFTAMIEPVTENEFKPKKRDVLYLFDGGSIAIAFEIVDIPTPVGITPHTQHYTLQKRDDLMYINKFEQMDRSQ